MAARDTVKRVLDKPVRRVRRALFPELEGLQRDIALAFESVTAAHKGIADLQVEQKALRDRLDQTLLLAEAHIPRLERLEDGLLEERRLNLRIAELTDVVTEIVLPLHDRDIDPKKLESLAADTL